MSMGNEMSCILLISDVIPHDASNDTIAVNPQALLCYRVEVCNHQLAVQTMYVKQGRCCFKNPLRVVGPVVVISSTFG